MNPRFLACLIAAAMLGCDGSRMFRQVVLPAATPSIFNGLRLAHGFAWILIVVGEMTGVPTGLGSVIMDGRTLSRTDLVITGMIVIGVAGFLTEYSGELVNTPEFKNDANAGYKRIFERLQKDYGFGKPDFKLMKAKGCDACGNTGYKGRVGLHELLVGTDPMKKLIQEHARVAEILAVALNEGMLTLKMDGMEKVLQGVTDMAQVRAVCIK